MKESPACLLNDLINSFLSQPGQKSTAECSHFPEMSSQSFLSLSSLCRSVEQVRIIMVGLETEGR